MKPQTLLLITLLSESVVAQDWLSGLLSDAASIYESVTSELASDTSSTSSSLTSSSSSSTFSTSSTTPSSTTLATSTSPSSSLSSISTSTPTTSDVVPTSPVPAGTTSGAGVSGGGGNSNTLAIVLGCTLGALALAAFLSLLFLCMRRRKRSHTTARHRPISPNDEEIESWRHEKPRVRSIKGPAESIHSFGSTTAAAPLMRQSSRDPYGWDTQHAHQNPFVPVPPPARRQHNRDDFEDTTYSGGHPYSPEHVNSHEVQPATGYHGLVTGAGAAAGGAMLGALATHAKDRHERKRSASRGRDTMSEKNGPHYSEDELNTLPQATVEDRRSNSLGRASVKEVWPFMGGQERKSMDSSRSRRRSTSQSQEYFMAPDQQPGLPSNAGLLGAATIGGLAGAAASRKTESRSPYRKGILKQTISDSSNPSSMSPDNASGYNIGPYELGSDGVSSTPAMRDRRDSALGTGAPVAAIGAVGTHVARHRRGRSGGRSHASPQPPLTIPESSQDNLYAPIVPSRSPKRNSLDYRGARYSTAAEGTVELPAHSPRQSTVSPQLEPSGVSNSDQDGIMSPVSPITNSQPGTWSKAQAEELGMAHLLATDKLSSQESSTAGTSSAPDHDSSDTSDQQSSGLVSAIQRIFSSQKTAWAENENVPLRHDPERRYSEEASHAYDDNHNSVLSVPRRKPASYQPPVQYKSQYGEINKTSDLSQTASESTPLQQDSTSRPEPPSNTYSWESSRTQPPAYQSRGASSTNTNPHTNTSTHDFAPTQTNATRSDPPTTTEPHTTTSRSRAPSRPGYGIGSGDPFDLARTRTDSSMTGVSLSNYVEPASSTPRPLPRSSASSTSYHEPTLAELRAQVQQEDRARERARSAHRKHRTHRTSGASGTNSPAGHDRSRSRSGSYGAGLRGGDDREFFNIVDATTGFDVGGYESGSGSGSADGAERYYGKAAHERRRRSSAAANENGVGVGMAQ